MVELGEVITAMVTPFNEELEVNYEAAADLANYLVNNGSDGILVLGTTGEVPTLTKEEKMKLIEIVKEAVGDRAKVIVGTGSYSTQESIKMTKKVTDLGVDGVMLVTPYYNKPPQAGLYNHFKQVAEVTDLPVILYNVPGRTSRNIEPETVAKLADIDNIVAIKEASGDVEQAATINRLTDDDFMIYSGDDGLTLPILSIGGTGIISVAAHLVGSKIKDMVTAYKAGEVQKAAGLNAELGELFAKIFMTTNPIPVKAALNLMGQQVGPVRPPLVDANAEEEEVLRYLLKSHNLI
ncbi:MULTISPECIES: 4-hydroxy-tetrahydrodipicolinate synthase [unclassified Candidatus Frackibacter]|uniref:4-hydroxy-tetrahydrodipicolinate synthase n=1 Tax=unclassified Candidatus Frackibacter TaxID=2648818 RepID=UPI0007925D79|nr:MULTISPECIES: 4-hydroxy-tetrahydrodipicolinate synthase [unclassified Candidatus Frackibacter]KXS37210.1 MAG: dihydrodipicolinate synthase [Candidatus Frackibacter sp. T328-2]SDB98134.1 4-hydroxy-tetrahydrodipicolinate synthase [Candidatus Frackibacter sp. WG11]SEM29856.1 4-hydroxy-tetrahydrodipicolinate synthase [Candidatus Frackibacter sp. WG12]SFL34801.1 4-hydroxy-tetrahydrodipicolinate synthase [Candidatus Frackibacter sp. WG13]